MASASPTRATSAIATRSSLSTLRARIRSFVKNGVNRLAEVLVRHGVGLKQSIVEHETRSRADPHRLAARPVEQNTLLDGAAVEIPREGVHVEPKLLGILCQRRPRVIERAPLRLPLVEHVVHLPEPMLQTGGFGSPRRL